VFEIVFLGTAAGVPAVDRGLPALMVLHRERRFLVDCGEGTQRQLFASGLGLRRLDCVLLTHGHLDHLLGLGGLASTIALLEAGDRLTVHGGASALRIVQTLLAGVVWPDGRPPLDVRTIPIEAGTIIENEHLCVRAFPVRHRGTDSFGFAFTEKPRRHLRPDRLASLGVPPGPARRELLRGDVAVLDDGRRVTPDEVATPPQPGTRVVVVGDAACAEELLEEVRNADALVIEATFLERDADKAAERGHLTAAQAATLAAVAEVGALYLTHLSGRYRHAEIEAEARAFFPAAAVARDFDRVSVRASCRAALT
jgi:ribonuclease Z